MRTEQEIRERIDELKLGVAARALCLVGSPETVAVINGLEWVLGEAQKEEQNG